MSIGQLIVSNIVTENLYEVYGSTGTTSASQTSLTLVHVFTAKEDRQPNTITFPLIDTSYTRPLCN